MHMLFPHFKVTLSMFSSFRQQKNGFRAKSSAKDNNVSFLAYFGHQFVPGECNTVWELIITSNSYVTYKTTKELTYLLTTIEASEPILT